MKYSPIPTDGYQQIEQRYKLQPLPAKLLAAAFATEQDIASFLYAPSRPEFKPAPCLVQAAAVIEQSRREQQKVFIFGDYDCDGLSATAIMYRLVKALDMECGYYVPNRISEGYGLNLIRLKQAYDKGYRLLITVDNGVRAKEALTWAKEAGMTVIVTDHHLYDEPVECDALIHPDLLNEGQHDFCGAAVALCLAEYMNQADDKMRVLAMIATLGDVVALQQQNVAIVREGIRLLNQGCYPNLLAEPFKLKTPLSCSDVAFRLVPRLNAAGRLSDIANPNQIVRFLLAEDPAEIYQLAVQIEQLNSQRQRLTNQLLPALLDRIESGSSVVLLYQENLHEGLLGLLAGRICHLIGRPVIIMTESMGLIKGSGRSINTYDLSQNLQPFTKFENFGGHKLACGLSLAKPNMAAFEEFVKTMPPVSQPAESGYVLIDPVDITEEGLKQLFSFEPFGQQRKLPLIGLASKSNYEYRMLRNSSQLKWTGHGQDVAFSIVSFGDNDGYQAYLNQNDLLFIGEFSLNNFNNRTYYNLQCEKIINNNQK